MSNKAIKTYSIKELEKLSGIKAHTIRIWEKRYQLVIPKRTPTNIRYYTDKDLKKILNISSLLKQNYKISQLSLMSKSELNQALEQFKNGLEWNEKANHYIHELITISLDFDQYKFDQVSTQIIAEKNLECAFTDIFFPLLERIGNLWAREQITVSHEHFLSSNFRKILFSHTKPQTKSFEKKIILFLPQWEEHELSLLLTHALLSNLDVSPIYLGPKVPLENLLESIQQVKPSRLISSVTLSNYNEELDTYLQTLDTLSIPIDLLVSPGYYDQAESIAQKHNVTIHTSKSALLPKINFV
ncbi:MerR family transcriptional regulator [Reichenbachiella carrageenanivorans]|uniref:MerR family transcriptional regulator n=1 Tax=Reichenbachiella carrageenanivorans TaxID=2979869 RepID=A0ABY6CWG6_9BACT|nr:MerR family transcriptional regulator [Reichenbachiella carrageenanivorans]UXX78250.1 MerR family transcriptional regulator [Reichenbachiella carrageenanivorans]